MTMSDWLTIIGLLLLFGGQCWTWYVFNHKAHTESDAEKQQDALYRKEVKTDLQALKNTVDDPQYGLKALNIKVGDFKENCGKSMSTATAELKEHERRLNRIDDTHTRGG